MSLRSLSALTLATILSAGCAASGENGFTGGSGTTGSGGSGAGHGGGSTNLFDAGPVSDAAGPEECKNVDLLFVVDSSGSMGDNQKSLIASFPGFANGIKAKLSGAKSYHVGVVTSSDYYQNGPTCPMIGSLITTTGGVESSNMACGPFASGKHYMDEHEPDLAAKFACAAQVGVTGSDDERMARGMLDALKPSMNAPGACNEGFSRQDSLLIVVLITDEDDVPDGCDGNGTCMTYGSGGTPDDWYQEIVSYKGGIAENIVVLSLLGQKLDNPCGAVPAAKLIGFTKRFGQNGYTGDICADDYTSFFDAALPVIDTACQNYKPPK